ncbi:MAG: outer membrane lipoprotein-sorting protein [bacterium]
MREKKRLRLLSCLFGLWALTRAMPAAAAGAAPGDVIDRTNWQEAEGLLPESVLNWIRRGDVLHVAALSFSPNEFLPPGCRESLALNARRYDVDDNGLIVDVKTGKLPAFVTGLPFPQIDLEDSKAGSKLMYNKFYYGYATGNMLCPFQAAYITREAGFHREVELDYRTYVLDGYAAIRGEPNPDNLEVCSIVRVLAPFDIAGTNVLTLRYRDERPDSTFTYLPAIRRVRRVSPANRSDAFLGSDFTMDDAWGYAGKVNSFSWKILRKADQLIPFLDPEPQPLEANDRGEYMTGAAVKEIIWGYQEPGYTGAPWFPTNVVWVRRPTYILEARAKDPYYNYGYQYLWLDAEFYQPIFKVIHDRSGSYWKTEWQPQAGFENGASGVRLVALGCMVATDDRTDHTTVINYYTPRHRTQFFATADRNDFSLAGFQKLCK